MSIHVDRAFLLRLQPKLDRFTRKKDNLYNFRCPLCGDSQKDKKKCRGYVYRLGEHYLYMCHNCGASTSFYNFLKQVDPALIDEYTKDTYIDRGLPDPVKVVEDKPPVVSKKLMLPPISMLPEEHIARQYLIKRQIPEKYYSHLYYSANYSEFVKSMGVDKDLKAEPRLVIPFHDLEGNLVGFQGRALDDSKIRYISIRLVENVPMIFGLANVNLNEHVFVFEGPFDSMFIDNAIAVAGSNLSAAITVVPKENAVLVFDNEPRNKEILRIIDECIDNHFNVVIWPQMIQEKDINDMILSGLDKEDLMDILHTNTFVNLRAKLEFLNWKKN